MEPAVAAYRAHRGQAESWMLGRFIVPAARLDELRQALKQGAAADRPWELSVLVGGSETPDQILAALPGQLATIARLETETSGALQAPSLEMPLPVLGGGDMAPFLADVKAVLVAADPGSRREIFLEVPAKGDPAEDQGILAALAEAGLRAKFRCGGVTAEAFPALERLAGIIDACARLGLPVKFTAGLHHPVRHLAREPRVMMHGFLNVFGAGLLAAAGCEDRAVLTACLAETEAIAFSFTAGEFRWRDHAVTAAEVQRLRATRLAGFGSCSFTEPCADLRDLGLPVAGKGNDL